MKNDVVVFILVVDIVAITGNVSRVYMKFAKTEKGHFKDCWSQGWKKYRTTGPLVPENILAPRKKRITPKNVRCNMLTF